MNEIELNTCNDKDYGNLIWDGLEEWHSNILISDSKKVEVVIVVPSYKVFKGYTMNKEGELELYVAEDK